MTFSKVKTAPWKVLFRTWEGKEKTEGKYLQNTFLINDFYPAIHKKLLKLSNKKINNMSNKCNVQKIWNLQRSI